MKAKTLIILVAITLLASCLTPVSQASDGSSAANTSASEQTSWLGTAGSIIQNIGGPMTGGSVMYTPDGQKSFNAKITCPNSQKYLEVLIQPAGSGDLGAVYVSHDNNMDGNYDYTLSVPVVVSGVCGNGIITCHPGTWDACIPLIWEVGSNGQLTLANTTWGKLGGCYCINNSCGSNLAYNNVNTILKDLGAGVVAAVQRNDPKRAISAAKISNFSIMYFGQSTGSCQSAVGYSGMSDPTSLYGSKGKSDALMVAKGEAEAEAQSLDPTSYYSLIKASANNTAKNNSCTIKRVINVNPVTTCPTGGSYDSGLKKCWAAPTTHSVSLPYCNQGCSGGSLLVSGNTIYISGCSCSVTIPGATFTGNVYLGADMTQLGLDPEAGLLGPCTGPACGCPANAYGYGSYISPGSAYEAKCGRIDVTGVSVSGYTVSGWSGMAACTSGNYLGTGTPCLGGSAMLYFSIPSTCPTGYTLVYEASSGERCEADATYTDEVTETVDDGCQAYETDSSCQLKTETVDGVQTINNFLPTYLSPFESCKTFTGNLTHSLCRQWWVKNRTYQCEKKDTNWDDLKARTKKIYSTTSGDMTQFGYTDLRYNGASWVTEQTSTSGISTLSFDSSKCEKACKLSKVVADTRAGVIGQAQENQVSATTYQYVYKSCAITGSCQIEAGETLVKDCQCISDFAEAATILATLGAANNDTICSSGVKQ